MLILSGLRLLVGGMLTPILPSPIEMVQYSN